MDDNNNSIKTSQIETASSSNYESIMFLLLAVIGLVLIAATIFAFVQDKKRATRILHDDAASEQPDVEEPVDPPTPAERCSMFGSIPIFAATTGFVLSILPNTTCDFVSIFDGQTLTSIGLWSVHYIYDITTGNRATECSAAFPTNFEPDTVLTLARVFAILAPIIGGTTTCMLVCYYFMSSTICYRRWMLAIPLVLTAIIQVLTLFLLETETCKDETCEMGFGAVSTIMAVFYWLITAFSMSLIPFS